MTATMSAVGMALRVMMTLLLFGEFLLTTRRRDAFHYNGPFQVNSIMTKLTHAANTAAADVASAKKEAEKLAMCMGDVDEEFEMELEKVVKSKKEIK